MVKITEPKAMEGGGISLVVTPQSKNGEAAPAGVFYSTDTLPEDMVNISVPEELFEAPATHRQDEAPAEAPAAAPETVEDADRTEKAARARSGKKADKKAPAEKARTKKKDKVTFTVERFHALRSNAQKNTAIHFFLEKHGISARELAAKIDKRPVYVAALEKGKEHSYITSVIEAIARRYHVKLDGLKEAVMVDSFVLQYGQFPFELRMAVGMLLGAMGQSDSRLPEPQFLAKFLNEKIEKLRQASPEWTDEKIAAKVQVSPGVLKKFLNEKAKKACVPADYVLRRFTFLKAQYTTLVRIRTATCLTYEFGHEETVFKSALGKLRKMIPKDAKPVRLAQN